MKEKLLSFIDQIDIRPLLCIIFIANLLDAYLTLEWIEMGIATEANPIMAWLLEKGSGWFLTGKISAIIGACLILFHLKHLRAAKIVALASCVLYLSIVVLHILGVMEVGLPLS